MTKASKYDRQLILVVEGPDGETDSPVKAAALQSKERSTSLASEVVTLKAGHAGAADLRSALLGQSLVGAPVTASSRFYLVGQGDWPRQTLSGWNPRELAATLIGAGLPAVRNVSIVADESGRDSVTSEGRAPTTLDSFAAQLHRELRLQGRLDTRVQARVYAVEVVAGDDADLNMRGRKLTSGESGRSGPFEHHRPHSKLVFDWSGGMQQWAWSD